MPSHDCDVCRICCTSICGSRAPNTVGISHRDKLERNRKSVKCRIILMFLAALSISLSTQLYRVHSVTGLAPATSKNLARNCSSEWSIRRSRDWCAVGRPAQPSRSFSAPGDQRAEIPQVRRLPAFAVGAHCMMRLAQILIFPFSPGITDQLPLYRGTFQNAQTPINPIL